MRIHQTTANNDADVFIRSRSISEPDITFDKSAIHTNRFKSQHFPFEYIAVDDLHYYRRRKPYLFQSNFSLSNKESSSSSVPFQTEYKKSFYEKPCFGRLNPLKRPPNLKVDAFPFLTGDSYKSEPSIPNLLIYQTEYERNFPSRAASPRVGPLRRPTNIKLSPGVMDIFSEQKSKYKPYSEDVVSRARPPMIKKPNNLFLTGEIELFPEYRTSYVPYSLDSIYQHNKPTCYHPKREKKIEKLSPPAKQVLKREEQEMERRKPLEAKILNNNYGVSCPDRYHQKLDSENNNFMPEYRSKYQPVIGQRSSLMPQHSHFRNNDDADFNGTSEYSNRYKSYDHFTKSAPIKKQDNLHMMGVNDMRPEYTERFKGVDMQTFERRQPYRHQDNLHSEGDFGREMPEYSDKYKHYHANSYPERAKPRNDFLCLNGDMEYSPEYRNNYVEFPRQRPIIKKPPTNVRMPSGRDTDQKVEKLDLPIQMSYHHESGSMRPLRKMESQDSDDVPVDRRPEYRRAMRYSMIKERSPSRASDHEKTPKQSDKTVKVTDPNDVSQILMDNKVNMPPAPMFDENNEVIVEPLPKPTNFKIPTRSPVRHPSGKSATYPLPKDHRFNEKDSMPNQIVRRNNLRVTIDDYDAQHHQPRHDSFDDDFEQSQPEPILKSPANRRKSPKFGRRAPNPTEEYNLRMKTNVIEANPRYVRERRSDIQPNRHEQSAFYNKNQIPMAKPPADSLASNYRPNYEIDKQSNYRASLGNDRTPFVVIDSHGGKGGVKTNSWMQKSWYDTQ